MNKLMNLGQNQMNMTDVDNSIVYIPVPSNQTPSFGNSLSFDIQNFPGKVLESQVIFTTGPIVGGGVANAVTNLPIIASTYTWASQIQYQYGNNILEIVPSNVNYIQQMLFNHDQDIKSLNASAFGGIPTVANRFLLSNTPTNSTWILPLKSFVNTIQPELLGVPAHNFRVTLSLQPFVSLCTVVPGTLTIPTCTILSAVLMCKVLKYDSMTLQYKQNQLSKMGIYRDLYFGHVSQSFVANVGSLSSSILLSNFYNTNLQFIYFIVRPVLTGLLRENELVYMNSIASYNIFNSSNESISNGPISSLFNLTVC